MGSVEEKGGNHINAANEYPCEVTADPKFASACFQLGDPIPTTKGFARLFKNTKKPATPSASGGGTLPA
jgi:hypothetical protein